MPPGFIHQNYQSTFTMKIILKELSITNFKGIKSQIVYPGKVTNIYGKNEAGKSSLFDAFTWLLFDKDSSDRTKFNIKNTVDTDLNRADHEVQAVLDVDGRTITLKKIYREIWTKKRGNASAEFTGNEAVYYWDDVPLKMADFQQRIAGLLKETQFKLITNTRYFNEVLTWQQRRECLMHVAGEITNDQVLDSIMTISNKDAFSDLINLLNEKKSLDDIKKQLAAEKKKIRDGLEQIPARIDELRRSIADMPDFVKLTANLKTKKAELSTVDTQLLDASKALNEKQKEQRELQNSIYNLLSKQDTIRHDYRTKLESEDRTARQDIDTCRSTVMSLNRKVENIGKEITEVSNKITSAQEQQSKLRKQWEEVDAEVFKFDETQCACPTCGQSLPEADISEKKSSLEGNFNTTKSARKESITTQGKNLGDKIAELRRELNALNEQKEDINTQLLSEQETLKSLEASFTQPRPISDRIDEAIASDKEYVQLEEKIFSVRVNLDANKLAPQTGNAELLDKKKFLTAEIESLNQQMAKKEQIESAEKRIAALQDEEAKLSQEIADKEQTEFACEQFIKAKMDLVESRIAEKFKYVTFKMFERQVNAGEKETCETLYNGVPYSDLNTAGKALAGIDIINTLSREFDTYAPIFIDNRESVTWIPETESQIINLIVSPEDHTLRVETESISNTLLA
jgi:DNA repair exonuclease SbcCD ATPase subunit